MSGRPCSEWMLDGECVIRARSSEATRSALCIWQQRCMYAAERSDIDPLDLEYLDAWQHRRCSLLIYRPQNFLPSDES